MDALAGAGCQGTFTDKTVREVGGAAALDELLGHVRPGGTVVVWRLNRLRRALRHLLETVTDLESRGVGFVSLTESIDYLDAGAEG